VSGEPDDLAGGMDVSPEAERLAARIYDAIAKVAPDVYLAGHPDERWPTTIDGTVNLRALAERLLRERPAKGKKPFTRPVSTSPFYETGDRVILTPAKSRQRRSAKSHRPRASNNKTGA